VRFNGQRAIGVGISTAPGGNVVDMGGKPVAMKPDTPHMDSLKGAGVQAVKDGAGVAAGAGAGYAGYKAMTSEDTLAPTPPTKQGALGSLANAAHVKKHHNNGKPE